MIDSMAKQFEKPKGILGKLAGTIMYFENRKINKWSIRKLQVNRYDKILEIGFGPGYGIKTLMSNYRGIEVDGIDLSAKMKDEATKRNKEWIDTRKVHLTIGDVADFQPDHRYNKMISVNNYPLWDQPLTSLRHLFQLLKQGGRIVLTVQPREEGSTADTAKQLGERMSKDLLNAGFKNPEVSYLDVRPVLTVCVTAEKK
ncbi:class I SAM-dependent methyltransferase [Mesobacillus jeotgali]|jgi:cyclopropane fatty-acyl-phospholipid synthase-like methyltransferase|uniref:Class I SAM-dependent methyltransferase n=1 Tax=Mesobacillus jeotgali TaxID=129985 RepID=A0ABY9VBL7_9BACI|nr:class I SAM-dependent methyltransferase [Mesobacillus jeotgali]WNF21289.1 class I SAM-dependent methyltransferase [Mesobacillus jeotgali]